MHLRTLSLIAVLAIQCVAVRLANGQEQNSAKPTVETSNIAADSADATVMLQELIRERKGAVDLDGSVYNISETIEIDLSDGFCEIRGSTGTVIRMNGSGPAFRFRGTHFKSADPSGFTPQIWARERMPVIRNLAIEGTTADADGIEAVGTMQLTASHVHVRKLRHGILLKENNRNVQIDNCHIYENSGVGIFYDDVNLHQSNIVGCHISYCDQGGIVSRGGNVRNIHITGCDLESNMSANTEPTANVFVDCRGSNYGTAEVAITGCTIQHNDRGPKSANIRIIGSSNDQVFPKLGTTQKKVREGHVTITGNVLSDVQHNIWLDGCRGVVVSGNTFWMGFEHNMLVENSSHVVVGVNNFDRNPRYNYGHALDAKNRIEFRTCEACTLQGLHIAEVNASPAAISIIDSSRMHLSGITVLDSKRSLHAENVSDSRFADFFISNSGSPKFLGGEGNRVDETLSD